MKKYMILYYAGTTFSVLISLWHLFVPWMFGWYSYIPNQYQNLIVSIDWVNLCFSLLLFGISLILIFWGKKVFLGNKEAITIHGFLAFIWVFRVALAIIEPWPLEPVAWIAYLQFVGAALIMLCLTIPLVKIIMNIRKNTDK